MGENKAKKASTINTATEAEAQAYSASIKTGEHARQARLWGLKAIAIANITVIASKNAEYYADNDKNKKMYQEYANKAELYANNSYTSATNALKYQKWAGEASERAKQALIKVIDKEADKTKKKEEEEKRKKEEEKRKKEEEERKKKEEEEEKKRLEEEKKKEEAEEEKAEMLHRVVVDRCF